jgi:CRP/FNR family transcriptional regulator
MIQARTLKNISCHTCSASSLCLPAGLEKADIDSLDDLINKVKLFTKGEHVFHIQDEVSNLYAVYQGSCKEYWIDAKGNECITNFYFPGDIIGMESLANRQHLFSVSALEDAELCVIPLDEFYKSMEANPAIMRRFIQITSLKMQNDKSTTMGTTTSERVCDFLMNVTLRMLERNHSEENINLPMSQLEISNYLCIAYETVNRVLKDLKTNKIINLKNKTLQILDIPQLESRGRLDYSLRRSGSEVK